MSAPETPRITRLVVAVHGIGSQFRYSTVQAVARQFTAFCGKPITLPLGAFHPTRLMTRADSPELGAYLFHPPEDFERDFGGFGFAEVFWADIPERAVASKKTTEESKAWARTIVDRMRALDAAGTGKHDLVDYQKASAVVGEMIDTIKTLENLLFLARKGGLFDFKLGRLLTDFLGDVQIVADFKDYGGDIFRRFAETMKHLDSRMPDLEDIYIIAHSEGTVVSLKGILTALSARPTEDNRWVDKVKGFLTIGSPLNKHIVLWPSLWERLLPEESRIPKQPILWRNYYDYGDPVGFDLQITRDWLTQNGWLPEFKDGNPAKVAFFQFTHENDFGFTRYPFPGAAHNEYWQDPVVFGHFIKEVVVGKGKSTVPGPRGIWWAMMVSRIVPYFLCFALLASGAYVLYRTLVTVFGFRENLWQMTGDVSGITCLLAGITLLSRMPRLDKVYPGGLIGVTAFVVGVIGYMHLVSSHTQKQLSAPFGPSHYGIICAGLVIGLISAGLSKWRPQWGMTPLITLGGMVAGLVFWKLLHGNPSVLDRSLWPLVLANAGFLYLWWLSALLFDLVYIWHQFINSQRTTRTLRTLCKEAPGSLSA